MGPYTGQADPQLLKACKKIVAHQGGCEVGQAVITTAGNLPAKFVIHTVGPVWKGGTDNEALKLGECYINSLRLAVENKCKSIAFPNISTGVYSFPKKKAATIAVETTAGFLSKTDKIERVMFVCFDEENEKFIRDELKKHRS